MVFPISNDFLQIIVSIGLLLCYLWENIIDYFFVAKRKIRQIRFVNSSNSVVNSRSMKLRQLLLPPSVNSTISRTMIHTDVFSMNHCVPYNRTRKPLSTVDSSFPTNKKKDRVNSKEQEKTNKQEEETKPVETFSVEEYNRRYSRAVLPITTMPGCEADGPSAKELAQKFPQLTRSDIVRFLIARKGNKSLAEEMIRKFLDWKSQNFPIKRKRIAAAVETRCFFPFGRAKDGSPVVYMRGGLYDGSKASPEEYALAAAYTIDWSLQQCPDQLSVTVIVHTVNIPGAPNAAADNNFIKLFIQVTYPIYVTVIASTSVHTALTIIQIVF